MVSWFGFAVFASLREITSLLREFSHNGAEPQRKPQSKTLPGFASAVLPDDYW